MKYLVGSLFLGLLLLLVSCNLNNTMEQETTTNYLPERGRSPLPFVNQQALNALSLNLIANGKKSKKQDIDLSLLEPLLYEAQQALSEPYVGVFSHKDGESAGYVYFTQPFQFTDEEKARNKEEQKIFLLQIVDTTLVEGAHILAMMVAKIPAGVSAKEMLYKVIPSLSVSRKSKAKVYTPDGCSDFNKPDSEVMWDCSMDEMVVVGYGNDKDSEWWDYGGGNSGAPDGSDGDPDTGEGGNNDEDGGGSPDPDPDPQPCPEGYVKDANGNCVPAPEPCETSADEVDSALYVDRGNLEEVIKYINELGGEYGITDKVKLRHFLSQLAHESKNLSNGKRFGALEENLNYSKSSLLAKWPYYFSDINPNKYDPDDYANNPQKMAEFLYESSDNDLGNTDAGDGYRYRGGGFGQLTGRYNYTKFTEFYQDKYNSGLDFVANPDLIRTDKRLGMISALWFFNWRVSDKITSSTTSEEVTYLVNGGYNGKNDRKGVFDALKEFITDCLK